ncbi:hypothetical protein [uncultured Thiothrix sp.]|uniref:hypothetical protein n=1 Tax=uncultured Thiothrix sp. TaxID=223185 RepID=UPI002632151E|nr:hypothetical protein [uncultured Thiothrix sp.]
MGLLLSACFSEQALAVLTLTPLVNTSRRLTLQVGSSQFGTVNSVTFNVTTDKTSPNNTPIQGVPSATAATAATTPANGILIKLTSEIPFALVNVWQNVKLTVDSSVGLACISGTGCGSTIIPFSTISWVSYNRGSYDINDGSFTDGSTQTLFWVGSLNAGLQLENTLVFTYANSTIYPAGQYTGRVTYTATLP